MPGCSVTLYGLVEFVFTWFGPVMVPMVTAGVSPTFTFNVVEQPPVSDTVTPNGPPLMLSRSSVVAPLLQTKVYGGDPLDTLRLIAPFAFPHVADVTTAPADGAEIFPTVTSNASWQPLSSVIVKI